MWRTWEEWYHDSHSSTEVASSVSSTVRLLFGIDQLIHIRVIADGESEEVRLLHIVRTFISRLIYIAQVHGVEIQIVAKREYSAASAATQIGPFIGSGQGKALSGELFF